jgi:hypothetical protein
MPDEATNAQPTPPETSALPDTSQPPQLPKLKFFTRAEAWRVLPAAALISLLYTVCFSGLYILPQLSFTLFCPAAFFILTGVLISLNLHKNNRAYIWALPMTVLALCNGIFYANFFTWGNALVMHGLFAAYTVTAMREQPTDVFCLNGFIALIRQAAGHWTAFVGVTGEAFSGHKTASFQRIKYILLGVLVAIPVLVIIIALLMSADAVFNIMASNIFDGVLSVRWFNLPFILSLILAWIYAVGYICLGLQQSHCFKAVPFPAFKADATVCATFLVLVNVVFLLFTFVQVAFLFNGGFLKLPGDMVYSQYAREGFFQLLFVTFINFTVILVFLVGIAEAGRNALLRGLLLALFFFTGVLIFSSVYRMGLYTNAYGHTTLRLCVYTFLAMETVLLGVTVWRLLNDRVALIRWFVLVGLTFYAAVNFTGSDYFTTKLNAGLFLSGQRSYIDLLPVGPDGLRALKPLLEDDRYVCVDYLLYRKTEAPIDELPIAAYIPDSYEQLLDGWRWVNREYQYRWQNWSLLK